ncbi:Cysteine-rich membrane protein 1 [Spironucleus salmonicida]|uniref:Cysteine-rich membrane protein 1 n=1 Tax=Spironucleus salmonicida TaxID=348837 RepID=V6LD14_9EUKA|nr:Cysteine-rich membrane protein 1 [Spironucleus salmonicida]|eukprot:EST42380.1 Cysteine-rich membrane protein 1 [Spironucleus salmonicida]
MTNTCNSSNTTSCTKGYFCPSNVSAVDTACLVCKSQCATCTGDTAEAATCLTCADGQYLSRGTCANCDSKCATCTGSGDSACQTCNNENVLNGSSCTACTTSQTTACTCSNAKNCSLCDFTMTKCSICINDYDPIGTTPCEKCQPKFFEDTSATPNKCTACPANCTICSSDSVCTACEDGFSLETNNCVACKEANCKTCSASKDKCTACKTGFIMENQKCLACPSDCANCEGDKTTCKICKDGFLMQDGTCTKCDGNMTEKCTCGDAVNCVTCSRGDSKVCGDCIPGYNKGTERTCTICIDGYLMVGMVCKKCSEKCETCSKGVDLCDTCMTGYQMTINQTCQADCNPVQTDGQACVGTGTTACGNEAQITECKCTDAKNCLTCGTDKAKCGSCLQGYKFESNACKTCEDGVVKIGDFCFIPRKEAGNLSGGAVTGIVIAVLVVVGAVGGGLAYYFIKKGKK